MGYFRYGIKALNPKKFYYLSSESLKGLLSKKHASFSNHIHIAAAIEWLIEAKRANNDGGVAAMYSLFDGWHKSYVETTGYIIPTIFNYAEYSKNDFYKKMAVEMADFELNAQLGAGAFPGGGKNDLPIVFNTGQVIFGLVRSYEETKNAKYKDSSIKAADWLISVMDEDGCWSKNDYLNHIHTYNTRTAWSLLQVHKITGEEKYKAAAIKNIDWSLAQQHPSGWFENNSFYPGQEPLTHTIAYTIRGILEAAIYAKKKKYLDSALKAAEKLAELQNADGSLQGSFNKEWNSSVSWSCLTGNSQMSIIWQKLFGITKDEKFKNAAAKSNGFMKSVQNLSSSNAGIKGGIAGAYPIYGWYSPYSYPNWAAKFFIDSLMLEENGKFFDKLC
jgi:uncharacterized protein YyaL (SSP411 family)